jgi:transcriptional regulator with XRE-family HTH domain
MEKIISGTVERIQQLIEFKNISKREFSQKIGISHSLIGKSNSIGSDKLERILSVFPDVNAEWLLTGEGDMLCTSNEDLVKNRIITNHQSKRNDLDKEMYLSENDRNLLSGSYILPSIRDIKQIYTIDPNILDINIGDARKKLIDLYSNSYLLLEAINKFNLGNYYTEKFKPISDQKQRIQSFDTDFDTEFGKIEDIKLKKAIEYITLKESIEEELSSIKITIYEFYQASQHISNMQKNEKTMEKNENN